MTVSATYSPISYIGNGVTTSFAVNFKFFDEELVVYKSDGVSIYEKGVEYKIVGASSDKGGAIEFTIPPSGGEKITIARDVVMAQNMKFIEGENFPAKDYENSLDHICTGLQELKEKQGRSCIVPAGSTQQEYVQSLLDSYTKSEIDTKLAEKADTEDVEAKFEEKADVVTVYTKAEVDTKIEAIPSIYNRITNCITEIPQDIKLELKDGVLTVKAGSKVYKPDGRYTQSNADKSIEISADGKYFIYTWSFTTLASMPLEYTFSGATPPTLTRASLWFDTANNIIKQSSSDGSTWNGDIHLPMALVTVSNGAISSIDQVFNGFGYIGSTVFALPNVKGLIPDGRNADGSLKNIEFVNNKVRVSMNFGISRDWFALYQDGTFNRVQSTAFRFDVDKNKFINIADGSDRRICVCGTTTGNIDTFSPRQPVKLVDTDELEKRIGDIDSILDEINGEVL